MNSLRITSWEHVRGIAPLASAGQLFADRNPGVRFEIVPHSARTFGEGPLEDLARQFDLIAFDHPMTGEAVEQGLFLPLDEHLPAEVLTDRERHSVGASYRSYVYKGRPWGLPLDAACIVSAVREDLLHAVPRTWQELIGLARDGRVAQGFSRMTAAALYFMLINGGDSDTAARGKLHELLSLTGGIGRLQEGSIQILEAMARGENIAFLPACYGYSSYSRPGFAKYPVTFHPTPLAPKGAVLGGAGLAVSAFSKNRELALSFLEWVTGADFQTNVYAVCGGQPAHGAAWEADLPNALTGGFYRRLRPAMESAWMRANTPKFHRLQGDLATELHHFLSSTL
jgi:multiple sugar transport system substrate-binding protein